MSSLKPKLLYQLAVSLLYSAAPLLIFPYVSRVLGPGPIGNINFIDYSAQFFILAASFGIPFYGVREVARVRDDADQRRRVTSELLVLHGITTAVSLLLFGLLAWMRPGAFNDQVLFLFAALNIAGSAFGLEWYLHGLENFAFIARRSFLVKIGSLVLIFLLVRQTDDYRLYYGLLTGSNLLLLAIDLVYAARNGFTRPRAAELRRHVRPLFLFFLTSVTLSIYTFFDTVLLGLITGSSVAVGFYTTALKIIRLAHSLISDVGGVLLPRVAHLAEKGERSEIERLINKSLKYVLALTLPLGAFFFLAAEELIRTLGGPAFAGSVPVLRILSVVPLIIGLTNIFFVQILLPFGKERTMLNGILLGSVVSIGANLLLCGRFGAEGAAWACVLAETSVVLFLGRHAFREVRMRADLRDVCHPLLASAFFVPAVLTARRLSEQAGIVFLLELAFCAILYLAVQRFVFRNEMVRELMRFLPSLFSRRKLPA